MQLDSISSGHMFFQACPLPYGLQHLLEVSGVYYRYPTTAFFSSYIPKETDVLGAGISRLVIFRLFNPNVAVLFFSFHTKEDLKIKDPFRVLDLPGVAFLQLPCCKEKILNTAKSVSTFSYNKSLHLWQSFAEGACKTLIKERISWLKHGNKIPLGDILNPLRSNCGEILYGPSLEKNKYLELAKQCFDCLTDFLANQEIKELLLLCTINEKSDDPYLKEALSFDVHLKELSCYSINKDIEMLITLIDRTNDIYDFLSS